MCTTRMEQGEGEGQNYSSRSLVYQTWCQTCKEREEKIATEEGRDPKDVKLHIYIGESSRSGFERGGEHLAASRLLDKGSHILKHFLEYHREEDFENLKFGMKAVRFHKSAFERQIHESTTIQSMRMKHHILNSRAEYNRCALPRLGVRWGDREYKSKKKKEDD